MRAFTLLSFSLATLAALACSSKVPVGTYEGGGGSGVGGSGGDGQTSSTSTTSSAGGGGAGEGGGANIEIHLRSSTAPFTHMDGLAGQTPTAHSSGVKSLRLYRMMGDPDPLQVFDFGQDSVEVDYADGADTLIYTAKAADLPQATFTIARVVHTYVKYKIDATMHYMGFDIPGEFDNMQVMTDGSLVDGQLRDAGYYEYTFMGANMTVPVSGNDAPVPEYDAGGGFTVVFEGGEWAYYFPVNLPVNPNIAADVSVILDVNMHESFRWQDETMPAYMTGVFDVTPNSFESVLRFGANSFAVALQ
jgi:hypothetical protein